MTWLNQRLRPAQARRKDHVQFAHGLEDIAAAGSKRKTIPPRDSFISVSSRSNMGAQVEVWFSHLPINELDWDEGVYSLVGAGAR